MTCQTRKALTTVTSTAVNVRQRWGSGCASACRRSVQLPQPRQGHRGRGDRQQHRGGQLQSRWLVENRVSMVAENVKPGGPGRSGRQNTPTIAGRRLGRGSCTALPGPPVLCSAAGQP